MNILILGAGALGSYFGGRLQLNGSDVTLIIKNSKHLNAVRLNGLTIKTDGKNETTEIASVSSDSVTELKTGYDAIFVFTKSKDTFSALNSSKHLIGSDTVLVTLQNGIGNEKILSRFSERVIYGCTTLPADIKTPGSVVSSGSHETIFYPLLKTDLKMTHKILFLLNKCGIPSRLNENIYSDIWKKAVFNSAVNVICALIQGCPVEIAKSKSLKKLAKNIISEGCNVGKQLGINLNQREIIQMFTVSITEHGNHKPSMLVDVLNNRKTEVKSITGQIIDGGEKANVQTPYNRVMYAMMSALEDNFM